jgi:hypothetical protein
VSSTLPAAAWTQGKGSFSLSVGQQKTDIGQPGNESLFLGGSVLLSGGSGGKDSGFIATAGSAFRTYKLEVGPFGGRDDRSRFTVFPADSFWAIDLVFPVTAGLRIHNVALGAAGEYRYTIRTSYGAPLSTYSEAGTTSALMYGGYLRVRLGAPGTTPGKFAVFGRYLIGQGSISYDRHLVESETASSDALDAPRIIRAGISFTQSGASGSHGTIFQLDFEHVEMKPVPSTHLIVPGSFDIQQKAVYFSISFII